MTPTIRYPMFSDEVISATELAKNTSNVLNLALKNPVTISRREDQFALLNRTEAARLYKTLEVAGLVLQYLTEIQHLRLEPGHTPTFHWLSAFDTEDLATFERELFASAGDVLEGREEASVVLDLIYEWAQSGAAVKDGSLHEGLFVEDPSEESPLSAPQERHSDSK
jgi:hypothetical protein